MPPAEPIPVRRRLTRRLPAPHRRIHGSVRWRLTFAFAIAMAAVLIGLGAFIYLSVGQELLAAVDRDLGARADALTSALAADPATPLEGGHRFVDPDEAFAQVIDADGNLLDSTAGMVGRPLLSRQQAAQVTKPRYVTQPATARDDPQRLLAVPIQLGDRPRIVVVGQTLGDRDDALARLLAVFAVVGPVGLVVTAAGGWVLAGQALRPVERMRRRAAELAAQGGRADLPVPSTGDELSRLAETLNSLLGRLHASAERERRFVDDASHELRTPLAVLKAELDLTLSRPRAGDELLTTLLAASRETDRLVRLAEDLLVLARVREGGLPLRPSPSDLADLLTSAVAGLAATASSEGRRVVVHAPPVVVHVDPDRVRQAVQNLVDNALRHGTGVVTVAASAQPGGLLIDVRDEGPGLAAAVRTTAFEPFRRGRAAAGEPPGAGLGLAIVKAVADAHGGTASAHSDGQGSGVRLWLPLTDCGPTASRR
jgi:two-component system OmpR family sensor kinase